MPKQSLLWQAINPNAKIGEISSGHVVVDSLKPVRSGVVVSKR